MSHIWSVVTQGKFGVVSSCDTKEDVHYIVNFTYDPYNIQVDIIIYGGII